MRVRHNITFGFIVVAITFSSVLGISLYSNYFSAKQLQYETIALNTLQTWEELSHSTTRLLTEPDLSQARSRWEKSISAFENQLNQFYDSLHSGRDLTTPTALTTLIVVKRHWDVVKSEINAIRLNLDILEDKTSDVNYKTLLELYDNRYSDEQVSVALFQSVFDIRHFEVFSLPFRNLIDNVIADITTDTSKRILDLRIITYLLSALILIAAILFFSSIRIAESSEKLYRLLAENVSDIIWKLSSSGHFTYVSPSGKRIFAKEKNVSLEDRLPQQSLEQARKIFDEQLKPHGPNQTTEIAATWEEYTNTGSTFWADIRATFLRNKKGLVREVVGVTRDITYRIHIEGALLKEKELLSVTLRSITDGVITTDDNGKVVMLNRAAERLTGKKSTDATGLPLTDVFTIYDKSKNEKINPISEITLGNNITDKESEGILLSENKNEYLISYKCASIYNRESSVIGTVLIFRDISEQRKIQEDHQRTAKLESIGVLAGGIAHDFNNLLTAILGNLSLVKLTTSVSADTLLYLTDIEGATLRASDLTRQLLTFSKGGKPVKKVITLNKLLLESSQFMLRGSQHIAKFTIDEGLWPVEVDEGQITQVINNLILNAAQAMTTSGTIEVKASNCTLAINNHDALTPGEYVLISVIDSGIGIPEGNISKIFDPFFTTKKMGSGLGLTSVYTIIKAHNGNITVHSEVGKGSTFTVYIPARPGSHLPNIDAKDLRPTASKKVLIMDDDAVIRKTIASLLSLLGHTAMTVSNDFEAVTMFNDHFQNGVPFNLVILDLTIPGGKGGKEVVTQLKAIDPSIKTIASSGYSTDPVLSDYKAYGFTGRLSKPYRYAELKEAIASVFPE